MEDTGRSCSTESAKVSNGLIETETAGMGLAWVCIRSFILWLLAWCSCLTPNNGKRCIIDSFACLPGLETFPTIGLSYPASIWGLLPCLSVSCFVLSGCHHLVACSFLKRKQRHRGLGEGTVKRSRGRENCSWDTLYTRRIYFQFKNKRKKIKVMKNKSTKED